VDHRLGEDHFRSLRLVPGHPLLALAGVHAGQHGDPAVVLRLPVAVVVELLLVGLDAVEIGFQLGLVKLIDGCIGHAFGLPVLQSDGVHQHQLLGQLRIVQRQPRGQHATHGMTDNADLVDALLLQQGLGVVRQLGEAELVALGLARTAETDLIRGDYAVAGLAEHLDAALPGCATEILAMQQERRAAVRLASRRNVHVGHLHRLALGLETIVLERMRIAEAFQLRAIAGPAFGQDW